MEKSPGGRGLKGKLLPGFFFFVIHSLKIADGRLLAGMNMYTAEMRHAFENTLVWPNKWACARTYGLGSKLPWDPHFLVESLSDSMIYKSYYTVVQFLHGGLLTFDRPISHREQHRWIESWPSRNNP